MVLAGEFTYDELIRTPDGEIRGAPMLGGLKQRRFFSPADIRIHPSEAFSFDSKSVVPILLRWISE